MRRVRIIFLAVSLMVLFYPGPAVSEKEKPEAPQNVFTINTKVYNDVMIKLDAIHTAGYRWILDKSYDKQLLEYLGMNFIRAKDRLETSPGLEVWTFRTLKEGSTVLKFSFARPWEKDIPPQKTMTYNIRVINQPIKQ